jgi:hypothetical protein
VIETLQFRHQHMFGDHIEEHLKPLDFFFCNSIIEILFSLMTLSTTRQPDMHIQFLDQTNISSCLFDYILETATTCERLEHSWSVISRDIEIQ